MNLDSVAARIAARTGGQPRPDGGGGFHVTCPTHADDQPSLHISMGEGGRVLLHCFDGCETEDVLAAVGLQLGDLFRRALRRRWRSTRAR